jgi:hypothetical protein
MYSTGTYSCIIGQKNHAYGPTAKVPYHIVRYEKGAAKILELYPDSVFWYGIGWYFLGIFLTDTIPKENSVRTIGIVHLAGTPFSLASAPFLMGQAPLLREFQQNFTKWSSCLPNLTVQKIPYIPYRIYQPASAGNLPIPAKLPVNRWDTTLQNSVKQFRPDLDRNKPGLNPV